MAKTIVKRKSEGAFPGPASKQRRLQIGDATKTESDGSDDDPLFLPGGDGQSQLVKRAGKARKSETVRKRSNEYDEDAGRTESQDFMALVRMNLKKKKAGKDAAEFWQRYKEVVSGQEVDLKKDLQVLGEGLGQADGNFSKIFKTAFAAASPLPSTGKPKGNQGFVTFHERSQTLVESAKGLVALFDDLTERSAVDNFVAIKESLWESDIDKVAEILTIGMNVQMGKIQAYLDAQQLPVLEGDAALVAKELQLGEANTETGRSWGREARKQEKAVRRLVRVFEE